MTEPRMFVGTPTEYAEPGSGVTLASLAAGLVSIPNKVDNGELRYNVKRLTQFGLTSAVGDGTTDDAPAVNALIRAMENGTIPVRDVYFPKANYGIGSPIDLPYFSDKMIQCNLVGDGRNASQLIALGSTSTPFQAVIRHLQPRDSVTAVKSPSAGAAHEISGFRIDCAQKAKFGILSINGHAIRIRNMLIKNAAPQSAAGERTAEIKITGLAPDYLSWEHHIGPQVRVEGGATAGATASTYGVWLNSSDNHVDGVVSLRHDTNANDGADICSTGGNNFLTNVHTYFSEVGFYSEGVEGSTYVNCEADGPLVKGWRIEGSGNVITGNRVFWPGAAPVGAIGFDIRWDMTDTVIVGNTVRAGSGVFTGLSGESHLGAECVVRGNAGVAVNTSVAPGSNFQLRGAYDGTGNALGASSVDLQFARSNLTDVASGIGAFAAGNRNEASGTYAVSTGQQNVSKLDYTVTSGNRAVSLSRGKRAHAAGRFSVSGDQQYSDMPIAATTTSTTPARLRSNASGTSTGNVGLLLTAASAAYVTVYLTGFCATTGDAVAWKIDALVTKAASVGSTAVIGSPAWVTVGGTTTGLTATPSFTADTTLGGYAVGITAPNSNTWHWMARVDAVEVA